MTTLKIHDLNYSPGLDAKAMAGIRGGGEPRHSFTGLNPVPVLSGQPEHLVTTDSQPEHTFTDSTQSLKWGW